MGIDASLVKELRSISGGGVLDCKKALEETGGNIDEALKLLRERGLKVAAKKAERRPARAPSQPTSTTEAVSACWSR